jgi:hypothetical protein
LVAFYVTQFCIAFLSLAAIFSLLLCTEMRRDGNLAAEVGIIKKSLVGKSTLSYLKIDFSTKLFLFIYLI